MSSCDKMILNLGCVEFYVIMTVVIVLVLIPVVAWIIKRQMMKSKKDGNQQTAVPPLMYITTVSSTDRLADIDIPHLPSPGDGTFLPPSYEEICNGVENSAYVSSSTMTINMDDELPDYLSVTSNPAGPGSNIHSHRGSMVLSTFYSAASDNHSARRSSTLSLESDSDSECEENDENDGESQQREDNSINGAQTNNLHIMVPATS